MSVSGVRLEESTIEHVRERLRKMTDEQLLRFGKSAASVCKIVPYVLTGCTKFQFGLRRTHLYTQAAVNAKIMTSARYGDGAARRAAMFLVLTVLIFLGFAFPLYSQTTTQSVPSTWLHDGKLIPEQFNFTIESPSPSSRWSYTPLPDLEGSKQTAFIVEETGKKFVIVVWDKSGYMGTGSTDKFVKGMQRSMPKDWRVEGATIEQSDFPVKGSSRIKTKIKLPDFSTLYAYEYIITGPRTYMLFDYSVENSEPPEFTLFVGSFALSSPPETKISVWYYALAVGITLAFQGGLIWISVKAKPLGDKPYRWGTYVALISGLAGLSFLLITATSGDVYGKACGAVVGTAGALCCIGLLRRRKLGVVMFYVTYVSLFLVGPFLDTVRDQPVEPQKQGQGLPVLIFVVLTGIYLKKRWSLMRKANIVTETPQPIPPAAP